MAKTREIVCKHYTYEGGPCQKRGIPCRFNKELQKCQMYEKKPGAEPRRTDTRRKRILSIERKEFNKERY